MQTHAHNIIIVKKKQIFMHIYIYISPVCLQLQAPIEELTWSQVGYVNNPQKQANKCRQR